MSRLFATGLALALALPGVAAAQSLDATLNDIRDQIVAQGAVSWTANFSDSSNGQKWPEQLVAQITNVTPNAGACTLSYHWKQTINGQVMLDRDAGVRLALVTDVAVMSGEEDIRQQMAAQHPTVSATTTPASWVVQVTTRENKVVFDLINSDAADRLARAFAHAAQLCGGLTPAA
jgi:hypothetical protein